MLSFETEGRVAKMLLALSEGERSIEISREVLCDNYDFDVYQVFKELDQGGKNRLDAFDLMDFLKRRDIYSAPADTEFIIQFYDSDGDHALSYSEFLNMVQSSNSFKKSMRSEGRMPFNVEYSLGKLLEKELNLAKDMSMYIGEAKLRYDFNVHDVFHSLKSWNAITSESLRQFMERQGVRFLDSDIKAIMKRLDINRDGRVDLAELHSFFGCPLCHCGHCSCCCCSCCHHSVCCRSSSPLRSSSPRREIEERGVDKEDDLKEMNANVSNGFRSTYQTASPERNNRSNAFSPEIKRVSPNLSLRLSPERRFSPKRELRSSSPLRESSRSNNNISTIRPSPNVNYEEKQFIDYLRTVMESETDIERMKIDLASRCDFNVEDAFRIFELDGRGYLTEADLDFGLSLLGVYATSKEIKALMKRFDLQGKGTLNYGDFFDMVTPYEKNARSMVESRPPNHCCCCRSLDAFTCFTRTSLQGVLRTLISTESKCNLMKLGFSSLRCSLKTIFSSIDVLAFGYFTELNLERYLKRKNAYALEQELDLLFIHLDRNRDGKIEYFEVSDELTPVY